MTHFLRKLGQTVYILSCLGAARMLGQYEHSGWDGEINYAKYRWRGKTWIIPTSPVDPA